MRKCRKSCEGRFFQTDAKRREGPIGPSVENPKISTSWKPRRGEKGNSKDMCALQLQLQCCYDGKCWSHFGEERSCKPHERRAGGCCGELGVLLACLPVWVWR